MLSAHRAAMSKNRVLLHGVLLAAVLLLYAIICQRLGVLPSGLLSAVLLGLLGILARRRLWPPWKRAAAVVVIGFPVFLAGLVIVSVALEGGRFPSDAIYAMALLALYAAWLWLPFVVGLLLGGLRL